MDNDNEDLRDLDPNFHKGKSFFSFYNGDSYVGEYCAHRSGLVWREGYGIYTTKDKQVYKGFWKDDKLVEESCAEITYPNGDEFYGYLINCKYNGPGMYVTENVNILSTFSENKPTGQVLLIDTQGREWNGTAQENYALLTPENNFLNNVSKHYGRGRYKKIMKHDKVDLSEPIKNEKVKDQSFDRNLMKEMEMKIFAKTKKTISNLRFEDSEWYKKYDSFRKMHDNIMEKLKKDNQNELNKEENEWLQKYLQFKKKYKDIKLNKSNNLSNHMLFDLYNSNEYKSKSPAISVFYPQNEIEPTDGSVTID